MEVFPLGIKQGNSRICRWQGLDDVENRFLKKTHSAVEKLHCSMIWFGGSGSKQCHKSGSSLDSNLNSPVVHVHPGTQIERSTKAAVTKDTYSESN